MCRHHQLILSQNQHVHHDSVKKKNQYHDFISAPQDVVYFLIDVETTGPKRNLIVFLRFRFFATTRFANSLVCSLEKSTRRCQN